MSKTRAIQWLESGAGSIPPPSLLPQDLLASAKPTRCLACTHSLGTRSFAKSPQSFFYFILFFLAKSFTKQPVNRLNKYGRNTPLFQTRTFVALGKVIYSLQQAILGSITLQLRSGLSSPDTAHGTPELPVQTAPK